MILLDTNILLYAHIESYQVHKQARDWLDARFNSGTPVGLPWQTIYGFLRISTNPRAFARPMTMPSALKQIGLWLDHEASWIPLPTSRHFEVAQSLLRVPGVHAELVSDAQLAALAIEHGLVLCSADTDFARFPGLRWENPLRAS